MMAALVVDSDSHIYEPPILWDRFVAPEYRAAARSALYHEVADTGERITVLNGRPARPRRGPALAVCAFLAARA